MIYRSIRITRGVSLERGGIMMENDSKRNDCAVAFSECFTKEELIYLKEAVTPFQNSAGKKFMECTKDCEKEEMEQKTMGFSLDLSEKIVSLFTIASQKSTLASETLIEKDKLLECVQKIRDCFSFEEICFFYYLITDYYLPPLKKRLRGSYVEDYIKYKKWNKEYILFVKLSGLFMKARNVWITSSWENSADEEADKPFFWLEL